MRRITMTIAAVAVAMIATTSLAQDKGWFTDSKYGDGLYNINFPGGTAAEYFNELGAESEGELNVIVQNDVDLVDLPPINVKHVTGLDLVSLPAKLVPYLLVEGSDNVAAAFGGPVEEVGAYTVVVSVDRMYMQSIKEVINADRSDQRFDLRFKGGTAFDYVNAIREAHPKANVLAMPGVERFLVPAVNMKGVTVAAALEALREQRATIDGAVAEMNLERAQIDGSREHVFTLSLKLHEYETESAVWSVGEHFELGVDEADLLSAVRAVLSLNDQEATVRFHPETRLLMVRGRRQTLEMVEQTLDQIQQSAWSKQKTQQRSNDAELIQSLRAQIAELKGQLEFRQSR